MICTKNRRKKTMWFFQKCKFVIFNESENEAQDKQVAK